MQKINWTPEMDALLGQDEDRAIADRLYREYPAMRWISTKLVQERRKTLGIGVRLEFGNYPTLSAFFAQMATD